MTDEQEEKEREMCFQWWRSPECDIRLREALEVMRDELLNADANVLDNDQINYVLGIVDSYIPALAPKGATE